MIEPLENATKKPRKQSSEESAKNVGGVKQIIVDDNQTYEKHDNEFNVFVIVDI